MHKCECVDYTELRKEVSKLYMNVLTGKLSVREALVQFPKDCEDKTIITAWYALCYLEADEDIRAKDIMYKEEQDDYLEFIAQTLEKGDELPPNIINEYKPYHTEALTANGDNLKGFFNRLKKFLC